MAAEPERTTAKVCHWDEISHGGNNGRSDVDTVTRLVNTRDGRIHLNISKRLQNGSE